MTKQDLMPNDILKFKNGTQATLSINNFWVINQFYDNDLDCLNNPEYNIIAVFRPTYDLIYSKRIEENKKRPDTALSCRTGSDKHDDPNHL